MADDAEKELDDEQPVESQQEEAVETIDEGDWDAETRALARSYGLSDEDLSGFSSEDELHRAFRLLDRQATQAAPTQVQQPPVQPQHLVPTQVPNVSDIELDLSELEEDDPVRKGFEKMSKGMKAVQQTNQQLMQYIAGEVQAKNHRQNLDLMQRFDKRLDSKESQAFGKAGKLSVGQEGLRTQTWELAKQLYNAAQAQGQSLSQEDFDLLVDRAAYSVTYDPKSSASKAEAVKKRSAKRTSSGRRKANVAPAKRGDKLSKNPQFMQEVDKILSRESAGG